MRRNMPEKAFCVASVLTLNEKIKIFLDPANQV